MEKLATREELGGDGDQMDLIFLQVRFVLRAEFDDPERYNRLAECGA